MVEEYILREGNFIKRRIVETNLGPQANVLRTLADEANLTIVKRVHERPVKIEYMFKNGNELNLCEELWDIPISLAVRGSDVTVVSYLPQLPLRMAMTFGVYNGLPIIATQPVFDHRGGEIGTYEVPMVMPTNFPVALATCFTGGQYADTYLFKFETNGPMTTPYPNCYPDGRMCLGNNYHQSLTMQQRTCPILHHIETVKYTLGEPFNYDLFETNQALEFIWKAANFASLSETTHRSTKVTSRFVAQLTLGNIIFSGQHKERKVTPLELPI